MLKLFFRTVLVSFVGCSLLLMIGCEEESVAPAPAPQTKSQPAKKVVATVTPEAPAPKKPEYVYSSAGQRDPFEALLQVKRRVVGGSSAPLTPLQKFDLAQFKIAGIIIGKGEPRAMVTAPGGKSFILKKGIKIGKNNGTVTKITPDGIHVEEKYYDFSGAVRTNPQVIKLPPRRGV